MVTVKNDTRKIPVLSIVLVLLGSLQMLGYILKIPELSGLGFSYGASPLPTVFSNVKGVDGFDTEQQLHVTDARGTIDTIELDQQLFAQFTGPFFLKESYAIFLAYSHILTPQQLEAGSRFMLCRKNIFTSFGINESSSNSSIHTYRTIYGNKEIKVLHPDCNNP